MRVELPEDYVPPQPTHPTYGYMTPEELEEFEAQERERLGIVPVVEEPGSEATEEAASLGPGLQSVHGPSPGAPRHSQPVTPTWSAAPRAHLVAPDEDEQPAWELSPSRRRGELAVVEGAAEPSPVEPSPVEQARAELETVEAAEPEQVVEAHPAEREVGEVTAVAAAEGLAATSERGGWVPEGPPAVPVDPEPTPETRPPSVLAQVADFTWDGYRQEWVRKPRAAGSTVPARSAGTARSKGTEPTVSAGAAAGGRGTPRADRAEPQRPP